MTKAFVKEFEVRWADLDPNRHLRHTSYNDYATHVRFRYLEENGFAARDFAARELGPVIFREETRFLKEVRMNETITVDIQIAALTPEGDRFSMLHEVIRGDGIVAATVVVDGAWMDLRKRKLIPPPPELRDLLWALPKAEGFQGDNAP